MREGIAVEIVLLFVMIWLISPIVLGIVCLVQRSRIKELERQLGEAKDRNIPEPPSYATSPSESALKTAPAAEDIPKISEPVASGTYKAEDISPAPAYSYESKASNTDTAKKPKDHTNVILILGAMFIILAGIVFAAAAWWAMDNFARSAVLMGFSVLFFGLHAFSAKKLGLDTAGRVFYVLGSVFLPVSFGAGAAMGLFGDIPAMAVFAVMSLLLSVPFFVGAHIYDLNGYAKTAYISLTAALAFLMIHIGGAVCAAVMAVISLAAVILQPNMEKLLKGAISREYHLFAMVNPWALAIISLFISDGGGAFVLPAVLFSAAFFTRTVKGADPSAGMYPMCAYLLIGTMVGIRPDSVDGYVLIGAAVMIVFTVLGMMDAVPEGVKDASEKISALFSGAVIAFGFVSGAVGGGLGDFEFSSLISALMVVVQLGIISFRTKENVCKVLFTVGFCWFGFELSSLLYTHTSMGYAALTVMSVLFALFLFVIKLSGLGKHFYHFSSDIIISAALALTLMFRDTFEGGIVCWVLLMAVLFLSGRYNAFGRTALPFGFILSAYPVYFFGSVREDYLYPVSFSLICGTVIYCIGAMAVLIKPLRKYSPAMSMGIPAVSLIQLMIFLTEEERYSLYGAAAIVIYCAVSLFVNREHKRSGLFCGYFLGALCFAVYEGAFLSMTSENSLNAIIFPAVLLLLFFGISIFPGIHGTKVSEDMMGFLWGAMPVYSAILTMAAISETFGTAMICAVILAVFGCGAAVIRKNSLFSLFDILLLYIGLGCYLTDSGRKEMIMPAFVLMGIISALCGRLIFREKVFRGKLFDMLSLSAFASSAGLIFGSIGKYDVWLGFVLLAAGPLNLIRKESSQKTRNALFSAASCVLLPVWWTQPFIDVPEIVRTELNLLPVAIACGLIMLIYREKPAPAANVSFAAAVISLVILFIDAVGTGYAADAVMLGAVIVMILLASFVLRRKRWFALSAASAAAEAIVLTLRLWNSRTWWIYLLAAGVILTVLGMMNERRKQQKNSEKTGLSKIMSDWDW